MSHLKSPPAFAFVLGCTILLAYPAQRAAAEDPKPPQPVAQQPAPQPTTLAALDWLIGEWQGVALFPERTGYVHKRFAREVAGKFVTERTMDMFPPKQHDSLDYEIHQDLMVYYQRGPEVAMKGFFVEGFVESATVLVSDGGDKIVIESTMIENAPPTMKIRFRITRTGPDRYEQTFDMDTGKGYQQLERLELRRLSR